MNKICRTFVPHLFVLSLLWSAEASAVTPDQCKDVFDFAGTLKDEITYGNDLDIIDYSMAKKSSAKSTGAGGGVQYAGVGVNYNEQSAKSSAVEKSNYQSIKSRNLYDAAISVGYNIAIDKWNSCIQSSEGGPSVVFKKLDEHHLTIVFNYTIPNGVTQHFATLSGDVYINISEPDNDNNIVVKNNEQCIKKGYQIKNKGCIVDLYRKNPNLPIVLTASFESEGSFQYGSISAYMPPEIQYVFEKMPYPTGIATSGTPSYTDTSDANKPFASTVSFGGPGARAGQETSKKSTFSIDSKLSSEGWVFGNPGAVTNRNRGIHGTCDSKIIEFSSSQIVVETALHLNANNGALNCDVYVQPEIIKLQNKTTANNPI